MSFGDGDWAAFRDDKKKKNPRGSCQLKEQNRHLHPSKKSNATPL